LTVKSADLQRLIDHARAGGADGAWLARMADGLVDDMLKLAELRQCQDPRKRQTLELAHRISKADEDMRQAGTPDRVASLCARFTVSRQHVYRLLKLSHETRDTSLVQSAL
jgi:hypothetical protein